MEATTPVFNVATRTYESTVTWKRPSGVSVDGFFVQVLVVGSKGVIDDVDFSEYLPAVSGNDHVYNRQVELSPNKEYRIVVRRGSFRMAFSVVCIYIYVGYSSVR